MEVLLIRMSLTRLGLIVILTINSRSLKSGDPMNSKLADAILDSILPRSDPASFFKGGGKCTDNANKDKLLRTGTTVLAFKYRDGILLAGDRKTSVGYLSIASLDTIKIEQVAFNAACGCAGLVADAQFVKELLVQANSGFQKRYKFPISVEGQARYLSNICRNFRFYINPWNFGLEIQAIIGGLDYTGDFQIFEVFGEGTLFPKEFSVIGSGTDPAMSSLRDKKKSLLNKSLSLSDAMLVAAKAIYRAGEVDNGTSDVRVATPSMAVITVEGFKFISERRVKRSVENILQGEKNE